MTGAEGTVDAPVPRPVDALVVVPIVAAVATIAWFAGRQPMIEVTSWFALAIGVAAVVGVPCAMWTLEHGWTRARAFVTLGAAAGALPPVVLLLSASIGLLARYGWDYVVWALARRASLPGIGSVRWLDFAAILFESVAIGAASGMLFWVFQDVRGGRRRART